MSRIKPYRGLSHKRLAALVRLSQHPKVPVEVVLSFGPVTEDVSVANYNSKVLVTATDHNGKLTDKEVLYRRLNLEKLKDLPAGELVPYADIQFPTTTHTIIEIINQALGINLSKEEIVDEPIESIPVNGLTVKVKPGSYAWFEGEHFFHYVPNAPQLATRALDLRIPRDSRKRIRVLEPSATIIQEDPNV